MALDFPASPVNGQVYDNFIYDAAKGTWKSLSSGASPNYLVNPTITNAVITATATTPSTIPLTVNGAASQSANLQEWKNSSGIVLSSINASGNFSSVSAVTGNLSLNRQDSAYEGGQLNFRRSTDNTDYWNIDVYGNTATPSLRVISGGQVNMTMDSYGRMMKPYQPSFFATIQNGSGWSVGTNTDIVFNTTKHNIGNHYSTSTGRFTVPVAGSYLFVTHIFKHTSYDNNTNTYWGFMKNGGQYLTTNHGAEGSDGGQTLSMVAYLAANDYISVQQINGTMQSWEYPFNSFSGFFLG